MFFEAFIAIGHVARAVGSEMKTFLDSIMSHIKTGLQQGLQQRGYVPLLLLHRSRSDSWIHLSSKKNAPLEEPIFQCLGMLAIAVGPNLTKLLHDQLDLMFACELSEPLHQALVAIAKNIPPLLKTIQGM